MWKDSPLSMKQLNRNSSTVTAKPPPAADSSATGGGDEAIPSDSQGDSGNQESSGETVQAGFSEPQEKLASGGDCRSGQSGETPLETPSHSNAEAGGPTADRPSTRRSLDSCLTTFGATLTRIPWLIQSTSSVNLPWS